MYNFENINILTMTAVKMSARREPVSKHIALRSSGLYKVFSQNHENPNRWSNNLSSLKTMEHVSQMVAKWVANKVVVHSRSIEKMHTKLLLRAIWVECLYLSVRF